MIALVVTFGTCFAHGAFAQAGSSGVPANAKEIQSANATPRFRTINKLSAATTAALQNDGDSNGNGGGNNWGMRTIPHWHGAFGYKGNLYPYIMAGRNPKGGGTTTIGTQVSP